MAAAEQSAPFQTRVQEVASEQPGVRVFVVESEERLAYERGEREKAMGRVQPQLEALRRRVAGGKLKTPEKIGAAAQRVLARHHGYRYYDWKLEEGQFEYFEHPLHLRQEQALEGKYLIQVEGCDLSPREAVQVYKELSEVERAFRQLKDVIEMRPIYHQTDRRVQAHLFVAALAFLVDRALEKKLKSAGLDLSSREAWQILRTVRVVEIDLGRGQVPALGYPRKWPGRTDPEGAQHHRSQSRSGEKAGSRRRLVTLRKTRSFVFNRLPPQVANMG